MELIAKLDFFSTLRIYATRQALLYKCRICIEKKSTFCNVLLKKTSSSSWRNVLIGTKPASQLSVLWALPQLLTESFLCQWPFCMRISCGRHEDTLCPRKSRKFPLRKDPGPTGNRTRHPQHGHAEYPCVYRLGYMGPQKSHYFWNSRNNWMISWKNLYRIPRRNFLRNF